MTVKGWILLVEKVTRTPAVNITVANKIVLVGLGNEGCIRCGWRVNEFAIAIEADDVHEEGMLLFCPMCDLSYMVLGQEQIGELIGKLLGRKRR